MPAIQICQSITETKHEIMTPTLGVLRDCVVHGLNSSSRHKSAWARTQATLFQDGSLVGHNLSGFRILRLPNTNLLSASLSGIRFQRTFRINIVIAEARFIQDDGS